jgi:ribonuclease HI
MNQDEIVYAYCDASGNNKTKKNGGIGIVLKYKGYTKEVCLGQYIGRTTAYMEVKGVLETLRLITDKTKRVNLYCDNQYCMYSVSKEWVYTWEMQNWIKRKNAELWKSILIEIRKWPKGYVQFYWIKGHNEHYENELCDRLAAIGAKQEIITENIDIT